MILRKKKRKQPSRFLALNVGSNMTLITIPDITESTKSTGFITIYKPIAGWKAVQYWLNDKDSPGDGFWEPWQTGSFAFATKAEAEEDAKSWAEAEEIPYYPGKETE